MCGIGGYAGPAAQVDEQALVAALRHRGPDATGQKHFALSDKGGARVFLAFARLSILDLSPAGNQPMSTEDGALTLIYNGETYNFAALREELQGRGHRFRSTSDTEVVLRGFRQWGPGVVERMRGMFAFALWDAEQRQLWLGRDRLGKKPLYYHHDGHRLSFASEVRALLLAGLVERRLDPMAVHGYLALGSVPQPRTIVKGVSQLLPGRLLCVSVESGRVREPVLRRYFSFAAATEGTAGEERVAGTLQEAVALRLVADVPVGMLLSGGIDSTAVAVLARRAQPHAALRTFTLTYGKGRRESEGAEAARVASLLGTGHTERLLTAEAILGRIPAYLSAVDQPSVDGFNTYLVAGLVREAGLKVALSGLGGDEVFLGYDLRHPFAMALSSGRLLSRLCLPGGAGRLLGRLSHGALLGRAPRWLAKGAALLSSLTMDAADDLSMVPRTIYATLRGLFPAQTLARLMDRDLGLQKTHPAEHVRWDLPGDALRSLRPNEVLTYLEIGNYLSNTLLRDADTMSMAHGVELRVPLCDPVLISRVMALPPGARTRPGRKKPLLVDAVHSPVLSTVAKRRKRGFVLPLETWLRSELLPQVAPVLLDQDLVRSAGLCPAEVAPLWHSYLSGSAGWTWRVWALFTLLSWVRLHGVEL